MNENFKKINECLNHGTCMDSTDREIIADAISKIAKELTYANTVINHLQKDLKEAEEDKEYNATLCNEKAMFLNYYERAHKLANSIGSTGYEYAAIQLLTLTGELLDSLRKLKEENDKLKELVTKASEKRTRANCHNYNVCGCNIACNASECKNFVYHTTT